MTDAAKPVWFITGCSTGFGRELAEAVLGRGWNAVVTARDVSKVDDLVKAHKETALALKLDVTKPAEVAEAVKRAEAKFGKIDVLVNNAGYGYLAAVEESEDEEIRAMFEANFFGLAKMTQAVLPGMRKQKKGHIVNISSIGGFCGFAAVGYYNATKFAVEGLSEALAAEVEPLGIKVLIVEPSGFRTDWAGRSIKQSATKLPDYDKTAGERRKQITGYSGNQPGDPKRAAEAIIVAVEAGPKTPLRLLLGKMAHDTAQAKLVSLKQNFDAWQNTSLAADFPKKEEAA